MVRMQIQFTQHEADALRSEASRRKVSISALVREAVEERLVAGSTAPTRDELVRRAKAACGRFRSGLGDVATRHDDYFVDSIEW